MTSFKRWFGAGAIVLVALALVACPSMVTVPKVIKEIPDMQFAAGATEAKTVQLGSYFEVEGDAQYEASSDKTSVATVSVSGAVLTVTPVRSGTANVEVTASKGGSDPVSQTFSVTVAAPEPDPVNQAPSVRTIPDISLQEGATKDRDLSRYYTDPEGDSLTYTAESSADAVATVSDPDEDSMITITAVAAGTATITVTASDGMNAAVEQTFDVEVTAAPDPPPPPPNFPPVVRTYVDDMSLRIGDAEMLTLSELFLDPEFLPLTYGASADPSDDSIVMVSAPDATSMITITAVAPGSAMITLTATDTLGSGGVATQTFAVTVSETPVEPPDNNQPRQILDIPDLMGLLFGGSQDVDLSLFFVDDDNDAVDYDAASSNDSVVTTSVSGSVLTVTVVAPGRARIDVSATDPYNRAVRASFHVQVINQAPMVQAGEPTRFGPYMIGATQDVVLSRYFSDPERDSLAYDADSSDDAIATVSAVGADSTITITAVAAGEAMIRITANDGANPDVSHTLTVTVVATPPPPNQAPVVSTPIDAQTLVLDFEVMKTVEADFSDPDDGPNPLMYSASSSNPDYVAASADGSMITITAVAKGSATITVTASDGADSAMDMFDVTVNYPPRPTRGSQQPSPVTFGHDETGPEMIALDTYFENATMYAASVSKAGVVMAEVTGGNMLSLTPEGPGMATVTVTPSNSAGSGQSWNIEVTVESPPTPNAPTIIEPLQAMTITSDAEPVPIVLAEYFGDAMSYKPASDNEAVLTATEADGTLTLTPHKHGEAEVTVTAINSGGETEQDFVVTVQAKPTFKTGASLPNLRISLADSPPESELPDLSTLVEDPDGAASSLTYSTKTDAEKKVYVIKSDAADDTHDDDAEKDEAVMAAGTMVTLVARASGTAKITVTVTDGDNLNTMKTFVVTVIAAANSNPSAGSETITGFIGNSRLKLSDAPKKAIDDKDINGYFGDADLGGTPGDMLTFSVEFSSGSDPSSSGTPLKVTVDDGDKVAEADRVATVKVLPTTWAGDDHGSAEKFTVTVTPKKEGAAQRILIIATDMSGAQNFKSFQVQVNQAPEAKGAQETPLTLGEVTMYSDTNSASALKIGGEATDVTLVEDDGGYFSDKDEGDSLTCNVVRRGADIFADGYPKVTAANVLEMTDSGADARLMKKGTAYLDVSCTDGFERSDVGTLTVRVAFDASIR